MLQPNQYRGKPILVLGLARSGVAVAKLFHDAGAIVTVNDKKERDACPEAAELEALGISVICGGHPESLIHEQVALVVKNPGIPYTATPLQQANRLGLEVVTEVEVAARICPAPIIGITGSNGKTTTTTWIGRILERAGLPVIVAGNIGRSLCDAAEEATPQHHMVVELSSFQLKGTDQFHPKVACLTNMYETHLDYHGTMDDYVESKAKLFANQTGDDVAVLNADNEICRMLLPRIRARKLLFSMKEELEEGVFLRDRVLLYRMNGHEGIVLHADEIGIPGDHNIENAMAATAVALAVGVDAQTIAADLRAFRGVEHRLEFVAEKAGVSYYNGSKATNPAATIKDLQSFKQSVVLIAGGLDRGMEYTDLEPYFRAGVRGIVALGETRGKMADVARLAGIEYIHTVDNTLSPQDAMVAAVRSAESMARSGDVVLLSPACASWDMFTSYEERGRMFKESVHNL